MDTSLKDMRAFKNLESEEEQILKHVGISFQLCV